MNPEEMKLLWSVILSVDSIDVPPNRNLANDIRYSPQQAAIWTPFFI